MVNVGQLRRHFTSSVADSEDEEEENEKDAPSKKKMGEKGKESGEKKTVRSPFLLFYMHCLRSRSFN